MPLTVDALEKAIEEAQRFIKIAAEARNRIVMEFSEYKQRAQRQDGTIIQNSSLPNWNMCSGSRETGAAKRASMDLQQALVALRK